MLETRDIDVIILCGGLGRRLRSAISDRPKSMAEINQKPFLEILVNYLVSFGFKRFIFSIGYKGGMIKKHFCRNNNLVISFADEKNLLGTGGAIKNSIRFIKSSAFLVINGDSFCKINFKKFIKFHMKKKSLLSMVVARARKNKDGGFVKLNRSNRVVRFNEKVCPNGARLISAGIYLFQKKIFRFMPHKRIFSLEYDLFPRLIGKSFFGYLTASNLVDIGTPKRLGMAKLYFKHFEYNN